MNSRPYILRKSFLNAKYMLTMSSMFKGSKRNVRNAINVTVCFKFHNYKQTLPKWQTYKESLVSKYAAVTLQARNTCAAVVITTYNPGQKSLGQYYNMHIFLSFLGSLLKQCIIFEIFLHFSLPPPYTKLKLGKNSGYTRPTLFVGWGGLDLCELENAPETQKCPKTFVHDCRLYRIIVLHENEKLTRKGSEQLLRENNPLYYPSR